MDKTQICMIRSFPLRIIFGVISGCIAFVVLFYLVASPPMHWFYKVGDDAGPASIYLPGGGFSGFWFHLGYLDSFRQNHNLYDYDYYCFSSACLSILPIFLNYSLEEVYDTALASQNAWKTGHRSRFEIVDFFVEELLPPELETQSFDDRPNYWQEDACTGTGSLDFLSRIKILVTTPWDNDGYTVLEPSSRSELKEYIKRTTWVPFLTGNGLSAEQGLYLDGAFSRRLHPKCDAQWSLPVMWETLVHTFSPGLSRDQVHSLWEKGKNYEYPIPVRSRTSVANKTALHAGDSPIAMSVGWGPNNTYESDGSCVPLSSIPT